jgi:hypothetical protein
MRERTVPGKERAEQSNGVVECPRSTACPEAQIRSEATATQSQQLKERAEGA